MKKVNRSNSSPNECIAELWCELRLPPEALKSLHLNEGRPIWPSSFKISHLALTSIGLTGLLASLIYATHHNTKVPRVNLSQNHAAIEFKSEHLNLLNGERPPSAWGPIGGLHKTADGHVRVHDNFPHHKNGTIALLSAPPTATREDVAEAISKWKAIELETKAAESGLVIAALRSYQEWDSTSQAQAVRDCPLSIQKVADTPPVSSNQSVKRSKCLSGVRVLELSRVIAAPVAGRTLAAHGADVLWVTSPSLPDLPSIDRDVARGKRTTQLNLNQSADMEKLRELLGDADVFLQSYRPSSLAARGLSTSEILQARGSKPIVCANLSAYGPDGPWKNRKGFDSLVQTCSGMNVSEAEHFGRGEPARPMPCQALDHAAGYFLAAGIMTALFRQSIEGGSYVVDVSLAGVARYIRSLGQYEGQSGFELSNYQSFEDVPAEFTDTKESGFGTMQFIKHSVTIDGVDVGWDVMPKPLGRDKPAWID